MRRMGSVLRPALVMRRVRLTRSALPAMVPISTASHSKVVIGALLNCSALQSSKSSLMVPTTSMLPSAACILPLGVTVMAMLSLTKPHSSQSKLLKNADMVQRLKGGTNAGNASTVI